MFVHISLMIRTRDLKFNFKIANAKRILYY